MDDSYLDQMDAPPSGPSRLFYALAALVGAAGLAYFAVFLVQGIGELSFGMTQVIVPGEQEIVLPEPGDYTIFHEYESVVDGKVYSGPAGLAGMQCTLRSKATGSTVPLEKPAGQSTYTINDRSGTSVLAFTIDEPGTYVLTGEYGPNERGPDAILAIDHGFIGKLTTLIFGAMGIFFGTGICTTAIAVITYMLRNNASRRKTTPPVPPATPQGHN